MKLFFIFHLLSAHLQHKSDTQSASRRECEVEKCARSILLHFIWFCLPVYLCHPFPKKTSWKWSYLSRGLAFLLAKGGGQRLQSRLASWLPSPGALQRTQIIRAVAGPQVYTAKAAALVLPLARSTTESKPPGRLRVRPGVCGRFVCPCFTPHCPFVLKSKHGL